MSFLFPNTGGSVDHVSGYHCLKTVVDATQETLQKPRLLIADKFRHRVSTIFALQELPTEKREMFYKHMGHTEAINRNVYQCPTAITEITEIANFLSQIDKQGKRVQNNATANSSTSQSADTCSPSSTPPPSSSATTLTPEHQSPEHQSPEHQSHEHHFTERHSPEHHSFENEGIRISRSSPLDAGNGERTRRNRQRPRAKLSKGKKRPYYVWSVKDENIIEQYFSEYIKSQGEGCKGALPGFKAIRIFLDTKEGQSCSFDGLDEKRKIQLIKTKVFNNRQRYRNLFDAL